MALEARHPSITTLHQEGDGVVWFRPVRAARLWVDFYAIHVVPVHLPRGDGSRWSAEVGAVAAFGHESVLPSILTSLQEPEHSEMLHIETVSHDQRYAILPDCGYSSVHWQANTC